MGESDANNAAGRRLAQALRLQRAGRHSEALEILSSAEAHADTLATRGRSLAALGRGEDALAAYDAAFSLDGELPYLAGARWRQASELCVWDREAERRRDMIDAMERGVKAAAPFILLCADRPDLARIAAADWLALYPPGERPPLQPSRDGRIRIGWFSGDFRRHAITYLLTGVLETFDRDRFVSIGFSFGPDDKSDERRRIAAAFDRFLDVRTMSDEQIIARARAEGCDIAIDLTGFTQHGRFGVFTGRAAPVQAGWLGYPGSMGSPVYDYIIADPVVIPAGSEGAYTESVTRLPDAYQPTDRSRRIGPRPGRKSAGLPEGAFVFCCFNAPSKIMPGMFDVWMRILDAAPGSVLWLAAARGPVETNLRREAALRGVDPGRLVFAPKLPQAEHLARIAEADLFLDTLPYNAHTTASDALWAGLPVLTTPGQHFAGRVAASLLKAAGCPELIAPDLRAYERLAVELSASPQALNTLRADLIARRLHAPLFDTDRFTRNLERCLMRMHQTAKAGMPAASFSVGI